jgi:hypothetical protein
MEFGVEVRGGRCCTCNGASDGHCCSQLRGWGSETT